MNTEKVKIKYVAPFESINMVSLTLDNGDHLILSTKEFNHMTLSVDHETVMSKKGFTYLPTYIGNENNIPVFDGFQIIKLPLYDHQIITIPSSEPVKGGV